MQQKPVLLIVDDDPAVLRVSNSLLTQDGFEIIEAASGHEALKMFQVTPGLHLDAVIMDVVMPGMHGLDLFEKVQELRPGLPVLFMSGHGENTPLVSDIMGRKLAFIQKPFTSLLLIHKVRQMLGT